MKIYTLFIIIFTIFTGCMPPSEATSGTKSNIQLNPKITVEEISEHIKYLSSDELGGRFPGTPESKLAQEYIINQYMSAGISPLEKNGYLQHFDFVSNVVTGNDNSFLVDNKSYALSEDYIPLGFSENATLTATAVFVGYGFVIDDSIKWNDYNNVNLDGKWAMILRGGPEDDNPHSIYNSHLPLRKKVLLAKDNNAAGVLFVSQDADDDLLKLRYDNSFSGAGIPVIHINHDIVEEVFINSGKNLIEIQEVLKSRLHPMSFELTATQISATVELEKTTSSAANVIALIPGYDSELKNEYIVIGGHYDHLGMGGEGSGSREPDTLAIHNGADDNSSGTAGVIEIGERLASIKNKLQRSVILVNFDAEERGLLGSKHFIKNISIPIENIVTMINMDMIGHLTENMLTVGGTGTSPSFERLLNELNRDIDIELTMSPEGYGPSDHATFYTKDIPVMFFFTGTHDDYHKPTDDFEIINLNGEKLICDLVFNITLKINNNTNRPKFTEAGPKDAPTPSRRFKVTFGIVPAYGSQAEGMEIDGVRKGGPAEAAGILKGDIITAINGKEIKSIYDYMYRLGELKNEQVVQVDVVRGESTISLTVKL